MRIPTRAGLLGLVLTGGLVAALSPAAAAAPDRATTAPPQGTTAAAARTATAAPDDLPNRLADKQRALRETALTNVLDGKATVQRRGRSDVVKVGREPSTVRAASGGGTLTTPPDDGAQDQYVKLSNEGTDRIFVILAEFGDKRDPRFPDKDIDPSTVGPVTWDGPLHNTIPKPGKQDNSTVWQPDYGQQHYQELYFGENGFGADNSFESVKQYYETQSSGRYSVSGEVTDWVKVPYNEARYGRSSDPHEGGAGDDPNVCGSVVCSNTWALVVDAVNIWAAGQKAQGRTDAQIAAELKTFDKQDRYDYDGDGNFDEPDGYIDHFQIVHAGSDESDGSRQQGEDAIWAHRWYVNGTDIGATGPAGNKLGGTQIGTTGLWVGDYTMQPENGGMSVFAHEYGHDLGLPDHYDTNGGDNGVEYWNLMAQSRLNGQGEALGTRAGDLGAWDKLQLGWLDYETTVANRATAVDLGPHEYNSAKPQAVAVVLPDKAVTTRFGAPFAGTKQFWSGSGDNLNTTMTAPLDLTRVRSGATLSMKARYDIEADYDYLYVQASTDGGATWTALDGTVGGEPFIRDASGTPALSGTQTAWTDVVVPLTALKGKRIQARLLYRTDGGVAPIGFFADNLTVTLDGRVLGTDGAESVAGSIVTLGGFTRVGASATKLYDNYYLASNRSYVAQDTYLRTGPYNFGYLNTRPEFVEHFPYQPGLQVLYWDTSYGDNNTSQHAGHGLVLPIDAHPQAKFNLQGGAWRSRIQVYDGTFGLRKADSFTLHVNGQPSYVRGEAAQPVFDDSRTYWDPAIPLTGVLQPANGVRMRVLSQNGTSMRVAID